MQPSLDDLLTQEAQQQLAELLKGIVKFDPETELLRVFTPVQVADLVQAFGIIRSSKQGQHGNYRGDGAIQIVVRDGKVSDIDYTVRKFGKR